MPCPVHFISGYLGCGKTTMVNCLLSQLKGKKVAVVLNDFGDICVDASFISPAEGLFRQEISGGQIFCPCTSGNFLKAVAHVAKLHPDMILVEPSGLVKPANLLSMISRIRETDPEVMFGSFTCVVDPLSFPVLSGTLNAVSEQAMVANRFVINKTDLVSKEQLDDLRKLLLLYQKDAEIIQTSRGRVDVAWFSRIYHPIDIDGELRDSYATWGPLGRPEPYTLHLDGMRTLDVERFLSKIAPDCLRAKGFVETADKGCVLAQIAAGKIQVEEWRKEHGATGLTVIQRKSKQSEYERMIQV